MSGLGFRATPGWRQTTTTSVLECIRGFLHKSLILKDMGSALCAVWYRFNRAYYSSIFVVWVAHPWVWCLKNSRKCCFCFWPLTKCLERTYQGQVRHAYIHCISLTLQGMRHRWLEKIHQCIGACLLSYTLAFCSMFICTMSCRWDIMLFFGSSSNLFDLAIHARLKPFTTSLWNAHSALPYATQSSLTHLHIAVKDM